MISKRNIKKGGTINKLNNNNNNNNNSCNFDEENEIEQKLIIYLQQQENYSKLNTKKTCSKLLTKQNSIQNCNNNDFNNNSNSDQSISTEFKSKKIKEIDITIEEQEKIKNIFHKIFVFDEIPDNILNIIICNFVLIKVQKGDFLYKKGSKNNFFYIVYKGELEKIETEKNSKNKIYKNWDFFGFESLISTNQVIILNHSLLALEESFLFILEIEKFHLIKEKHINLILEEKYNFIHSVLLFKNLDSVIKHSIAEKMKLIIFPKNYKIISKGEKNNNKSIYFIKNGSVSCKLKEKEIKILNENNFFGHVSILLKCERTLDVFAKENCQCFEIKESDLINIIGNDFTEIILYSIFEDILLNNNYFYEIVNENNLQILFKKFHLFFYKKNEKINEKIEEKKLKLKRIIIIIEGNFLNSNSLKVKKKSGEILGEETLKNNLEIPNDLIAFPDTLTLEANLDEIINDLDEDFKENFQNFLKKISFLMKIPIFKQIPENKIKSIANSIKKENFQKNQIIIQENQPGQKFYVIFKGTCEVYKNNKKIRELEKNSFFGEISLLKNVPRTATVVAKTNVALISLEKEQFLQISNEKSLKLKLLKQINLQDDSIELNDLYFIEHLGSGKFGSVSLVHNNTFIYAIKAQIKQNANVNKRFAEYLINERKIMFNLDHPFIIKIVKSLKNEFCVFFLLEFINGISLNSLLYRKVPIKLTIFDIIFYIASVLLATDYIHKKRIVHRDIKPTNIMISKTGFVKLIDFGTSKFINDYTCSLLGTPHYIAPEILAGKGYSFSCDFWSIGILTYEIYYKKFPFGNYAKDAMDVYNEIIYCDQVNFEQVNNEDFAFVSMLQDFIKGLLEKEPEKRLCSLKKIKKLRIFEDFDWNKLLNKEIKPPFIPEIINLKDLNLLEFNICYENLILTEIKHEICHEINNNINFNFNNHYYCNENSNWDEEF